MTELSSTDLAHWQQCQERVAGYLTTNGLIEISLCGLYATTVAVLIALGQSLAMSSNYVVFSLVIPVFSLVTLALSVNVYSWIRLQLEYLALMALHPGRLRRILTYEEWKAECQQEWLRRSRWRRSLAVTWEAVKLFVRLPFRLNDIYHYYFFLYVGAAISSLGYAVSKGTPWGYIPALVVLQWLILTVGTRDCTSLAAVRESVRRGTLAPADKQVEKLPLEPGENDLD